MPIRFQGNCTPNVSRDAKYHIRLHGGARVQINYEVDEGEKWLLATREHPELVAMVNHIWEELGAAPGGAFYINEYQQVLVPDRAERIFYLAGTYSEPLRFLFDGGDRKLTISGEALDLEGNPLAVLQPWKGLHQGLRYVLAAGGHDVYYTSSPRPDVQRTMRLSREVGSDAADQIASMVRAAKGWQGGRFYVNEWREMFAPRLEDDRTDYLYIGRLDLKAPWFRQPHSD